MTGQEIFKITMGLMRKLMDDGTVNEITTKKWKNQAPSILTILLAELTSSPVVIDSLDQELNIDDKSAMMLLPYGLAAHFLINQNPEVAAYYNDRYEELKRRILAEFTDIHDAYECADDAIEAW